MKCHPRIIKHRLCSRFLEICDQVVTFLALFQATESHFGAWYELLGILKIHELGRDAVSVWSRANFMTILTRVCSSQGTSACLLASV